MTRYGYIGLGMMGSAMADNLIRQAGDGAVTVHDIDPVAVDVAVATGAVPAASPAEVARASDVVSVCVPAAAHIDAVLSGPGGIIWAAPGLAPRPFSRPWGPSCPPSTTSTRAARS